MKFILPLSLIFSALSLLSLCTTGSTKPTNSMTRIQEVFRTLMGANKPMMIESRGKKAAIIPFRDGIADEAKDERLAASLQHEYRTTGDGIDNNANNDNPYNNNNYDQQRIIWLLTGENIILPPHN